MKGNFLVYVIHLPLTNNINYNLYHVLPVPIQIRNTESKFILLLPEHEYLLPNTAKQYFASLRAEELTNLRQWAVLFAGTQPIQLTHLDKECKAQMLQAIRTIPSTCSERVAKLKQSGHKWITMSGYLLPWNLTISLLCSKHEPSVTLIGRGKQTK